MDGINEPADNRTDHVIRMSPKTHAQLGGGRFIKEQTDGTEGIICADGTAQKRTNGAVVAIHARVAVGHIAVHNDLLRTRLKLHLHACVESAQLYAVRLAISLSTNMNGRSNSHASVT